jgi:hypothetical protein
VLKGNVSYFVVDVGGEFSCSGLPKAKVNENKKMKVFPVGLWLI